MAPGAMVPGVACGVGGHDREDLLADGGRVETRAAERRARAHLRAGCGTLAVVAVLVASVGPGLGASRIDPVTVRRGE